MLRKAASVAGIDPELAAPEAEAVIAPAAAALGFRIWCGGGGSGGWGGGGGPRLDSIPCKT